MKKLFLFLSLSFVLFSCKKDPKAGNVTLRIEHIVGDKPFEMDTMLYKSSAKHSFKITKLKYYISEITYIKTDGTEEVQPGGFLIDLREEKETYVKIPYANISPGTYNKIRFQFGINKTNNVTDYLPQTIANQKMFWPAPLGPGAYHYMQFEGKYDSLDMGIEKSFNYHSGPTMGNDNSFSVNLGVSEFTVDNNSFNVIVNADVLEWLQNPTAYNFPDYSMVMTNQGFQKIHQENGKTVFSFKQLTENAK